MPSETPTTVRTTLDLRLVLSGDRGLLVPAILHYDAAEPYAVTATFRTADGDITWLFARDLLADGLEHLAGDGDVAVWPAHTQGVDRVSIALTSPDGQALLEADRPALLGFLHATYQVVPSGQESEHLDVDAAIAALLADAG